MLKEPYVSLCLCGRVESERERGGEGERVLKLLSVYLCLCCFYVQCCCVL